MHGVFDASICQEIKTQYIIQFRLFNYRLKQMQHFIIN